MDQVRYRYTQPTRGPVIRLPSVPKPTYSPWRCHTRMRCPLAWRMISERDERCSGCEGLLTSSILLYSIASEKTSSPMRWTDHGRSAERQKVRHIQSPAARLMRGRDERKPSAFRLAVARQSMSSLHFCKARDARPSVQSFQRGIHSPCCWTISLCRAQSQVYA